jgi:hypothetical protein
MSRYRAHFGTCDQTLLSVRRLFSESCCLLPVGRPLWREIGCHLSFSVCSNLSVFILYPHLRVFVVFFSPCRQMPRKYLYWPRLLPDKSFPIHHHQLWASASISNIEILERFQRKVLRKMTDAPWYVPNMVLRQDQLKRKSTDSSPNTGTANNLAVPPDHRRLRRHLPTRFHV